ncbi:MAG: glycosyltransferase [Bacteroidota bacterium]
MRKYSIIIPVYNRPQEVDELLESLTHQTYSHFEVLIIEDGSSEKCEEVVAKYKEALDVKYFFKENSGQGFTRNYGYERASGDYFVVFDSDCLIPTNYFEAVESQLNDDYLDCYGGPDKAHEDFTPVQKAINYSMTSMFTTGGIRGKKKHVGKFEPRSFNFGISREVYEKTGGFIITRMGEDIEFSLRIRKMGFRVGLISEAFVYHKRRTDFVQFYKQAAFFGSGRVNLNDMFPENVKAVYFFPAAFVISLVIYLLTPLVSMPLFMLGSVLLALLYLMIFIDATAKNKSIYVGLLSIIASFIQIFAYGNGFIKHWWKKKVLKSA